LGWRTFGAPQSGGCKWQYILIARFYFAIYLKRFIRSDISKAVTGWECKCELNRRLCSVLTAIAGVPSIHSIPLFRWMRGCVLLSATNARIYTDAWLCACVHRSLAGFDGRHSERIRHVPTTVWSSAVFITFSSIIVDLWVSVTLARFVLAPVSAEAVHKLRYSVWKSEDRIVLMGIWKPHDTALTVTATFQGLKHIVN